MKSLRNLVLVFMVLVFTASTAFAQATPATPATPAEGAGKGQKMSIEERKAKREANQAKKEDMFKKRVEKANELMAKLEAAMASGKITDKMKANMLEKVKKHLELMDYLMTEMKENQKSIEEHLKTMDAMKVKGSDLLTKLTSYTPPAAATTTATPATPAAPAVPEKK